MRSPIGCVCAVSWLLVLSACGGATSKDEPGSSGGSTAAGATGSGGKQTSGGSSATGGSTSAAGGASATGGNAQGGRIGAGGGPSAGGSPHSGGSTSAQGGAEGGASDRCSLPPESGNCDAFFPKLFHNPETHRCEPFIYGGCGGNENRFDSIADCMAACPGSLPGDVACDRQLDCRLTSPGCCGACEPVDASSLIAVNVSYARDTDCHVSCGPCPDVPADQTTSRYFFADCVSHRCEVADLRDSSATECAATADCALRAGSGCCEQCSGPAVGVNQHADLKQLLCGGEDAGCPPCAPDLGDYVVACEQGKCVAREKPCTHAHPCP